MMPHAPFLKKCQNIAMTDLWRISLALTLTLFACISVSAAEECGKPADKVVNTPALYDFSPSYSEVLRTTIREGRFAVYAAKHDQEKAGDRISYLKSDTGGDDWSNSPAIMPNIPLTGVHLFDAGNGVIYKFESRRALRSMNGGSSWQAMNSEIEGVKLRSLVPNSIDSEQVIVVPSFSGADPSQPLTIFASLSLGVPDPDDDLRFNWYRALPGIFVSRDGGDHWSLFSNQLMNGTVVAPNPFNPREMISVAEEGVVYSLDGGASWFPVMQQAILQAPGVPTSDNRISQKEPLTEEERAFHNRLLQHMKLSLFQVAFTESGDIYLLCNKGIYRLKQGQRTWKWLDTGNPRLGFANSLAINPLNSAEMFVGTDAGILRSDDSGCHFHAVLR